jgi:hypothetical protein
MTHPDPNTTHRTQTGVSTGVFHDREAAERAYESLRARGYEADDVNILMTDETRKRWYPADETSQSELGNKAIAGAGVGGAIGTAVGALLAVVAATATVAVPGLGLLAAGPIAAALAGAGAGGVTGGLIGAMVGAGIPEDRAKEYEGALKRGGMVMSVNPRSSEDAAFFRDEWQSAPGSEARR